MDKKTEALKLALEVMNLARGAHGRMLLSDPSQEAWKAWGVSAALTKAMTVASEALAEQLAQQQCMEHGECFGGECIYPTTQPAQQQEPVAVTYKEVWGAMNALYAGDIKQVQIALEMENKKLYTSPPASKPWVGLTPAEVHDIWCYNHTPQEVCDAVEAKLREKNA